MPESGENGHGTPSREDVLDGPVPERPAPRTSFHRGRDFIAIVVIVVVAVVAGVLIGTSSDIAATTSQTGPAEAETPEDPSTLPPTFGEVWRAPSGATPVPVAVGPTVVTGDGGEVVGHDPLTGSVRWRYARDIPLCTVGSAWSEAIAVFRRTETDLPSSDSYSGGNCSEVTTLKAASGERDRQRNGDAEVGTRLLSDGVHVTATGKRLLNTWRSDLVLTMQYGTLPDLVNPDKQPRTNCNYGSVAVSAGRIAVIERCPAKTDGSSNENDRLSVYKPTAKESDTPTVDFSVPVGGRGARLVAMNETMVAVALPSPARLAIFDSAGTSTVELPLPIPESDLAGDPPTGAVSTTRTTGALYWFTGTSTIALSLTDLRPLWTVQDTLGSGTVFAGYLLLPVQGALLVIDQASGAQVARAPVNRQDYDGPVSMATLGPIVLEQRGSTLVALR
ncbi:MAG: hypothetical protein ABW215_11040 [Kibdelosporangium sp.]